jgi:hypothetical protein
MNLFRFKPALLPLLFFWQTVPPSTAPFSHFRYKRLITLSRAPSPIQACAILDADVFAHAASALKDLRLYSGPNELPYTTTVSEPAQQDSDDARILNLGVQSGRLVFDLEMPRRPYTGVILDLAPRDYIATAAVTGIEAPGSRKPVSLGTFTLFDLTGQHLFRSTGIPLSESTYPYLHLDLSLVPAPGNASSAASLNLPASIKSALVPPSREAQSLYTATQQKTSLLQTGHESVATFKVQARVPIERIAFTLPPGYKGDFSRSVKIEARGVAGEGPDAQDDPDTGTPFNFEDASGTILHIHKSVAGHDLATETLTIPVAIGSNMQQPASVEVHVENGTDESLPLSVTLQMRQRRICFDAASATAPLTLYYGAPSLDAPAYENTKLFQSTASPRIAQLEAESLNTDFTAAPPPRGIAQRPVLRWIAILGCVCIFALLVIRSTHKRRR